MQVINGGLMMSKHKIVNPDTRKESLRFGKCTFERGAYVTVVATRKEVEYVNYDVAIVDKITGVIVEINNETVVIKTIAESSNEATLYIPVERISKIYTLHVPYSTSKFVNWMRKKVANHNNKKMLKHTRKTLYELHKY